MILLPWSSPLPYKQDEGAAAVKNRSISDWSWVDKQSYKQSLGGNCVYSC